MQYFVSIENKPQQWWQVYILYQSLKRFSLENQLLVGMAETDHLLPPVPYRYFFHENVGKIKQFLPINKPYAIQQAISQGLLRQPFTVVDPDMFLMTLPKLSNKPIMANYVPYMELEFLNKHGHNIKNHSWKPVGYVYQFNDVDNKMFENIYKKCEDLLKYQFSNMAVNWHREMVGFCTVISDIETEVTETLEMPLDEKQHDGGRLRTNSAFVHYPSGYLPWFDKRFFNGIHDVPTKHYHFLVREDKEWAIRLKLWKVWNNGKWKSFLDETAMMPKLPWETILEIPEETKNILHLKSLVQEINSSWDFVVTENLLV